MASSAATAWSFCRSVPLRRELLQEPELSINRSGLLTDRGRLRRRHVRFRPRPVLDAEDEEHLVRRVGRTPHLLNAQTGGDSRRRLRVETFFQWPMSLTRFRTSSTMVWLPLATAAGRSHSDRGAPKERSTTARGRCRYRCTGGRSSPARSGSRAVRAVSDPERSLARRWRPSPSAGSSFGRSAVRCLARRPSADCWSGARRQL